MLRALKRWAKLPYLKQHRQLAADRALLEVGKVAGTATCPDLWRTGAAWDSEK
jgi:hypothetical protein